MSGRWQIKFPTGLIERMRTRGVQERHQQLLERQTVFQEELQTTQTQRATTQSSLAVSLADSAPAQDATGWLDWRGPNQNGTSNEVGLPDSLAVEDAKWTFDMRGRGTPVIAPVSSVTSLSAWE